MKQLNDLIASILTQIVIILIGIRIAIAGAWVLVAILGGVFLFIRIIGSAISRNVRNRYYAEQYHDDKRHKRHFKIFILRVLFLISY